jgi:ribosomal protein L11 methyltransferase
LCLELLADELQRRQDAPTLLDVGCGSGVLSIAAAKLGACVTASDLDPWCVAATRENTIANDVQVEVVQVANLDWVDEPFEIVIANLMSALLIGLAADLARATRDGGTLIVSGISSPRAGDVEAALNGAGFTTVLHGEEDGEQRGDFIERWAAFVLTKQPAAV